MPNAKVLSEKQAIVAELAERLGRASGGLLIDYKGINVADDTRLRAELRQRGADYTVVKNTLTRLAVDKAGMNKLDDVLSGTTSLATTEGDAIAVIRAISDFSKKANGAYFVIKAGFLEGQVLTQDELAEIAELSSKDALYAKVLGTMLAPITALAVCLGQILEQKGGSATEAGPESEPAAE